MSRIAMFVFNDCTWDSRVLREAATLQASGHTVTIIALPRDPLLSVPSREVLESGVELVRVPAPRAWRIWLGIRRHRRRRRRGQAPPVAVTPHGPGGSMHGVRALRLMLRWRYLIIAWGRAAARTVPDADIYHGHDLSGMPGAAAGARRNRGLLVYDSHEVFLESGFYAALSPWARAILRSLEARWIRKASAVITVNRGVEAVLRARYRPARVAVIYNCSPRWVPTEPGRDLLRAAAGIPVGAPVVLYHGVLRPERGLLQVIGAMLEPGMEDAHLVFLGFGRMSRQLSGEAAKEQYRGRIHILPGVPPGVLREWVASADVGVMPNQPQDLNERLSTPNKLFECLGSGVPVVLSDFPERHRIVMQDPDGPLGSVCDPTRPADIARAIRSVIELPPEERAALRARCLKAAHERWNWETEGAKLDALYDELPTRSAASGSPEGISRVASARLPRASLEAPGGAHGGRRPTVTLLFGNPADHHQRAARMAASLAADGWSVTIVARAATGLPDRERHPGWSVIRIVPPTGPWWLPAPRLPPAPVGAMASGETGEPDARGGSMAGGGTRPPGLRGRIGTLLLNGPGRAIQAVRYLLVARAWAAAVERAVSRSDVWQANGLVMLPVALRLARRNGGRVVYDALEIYPESGRFARLPRAWRRALGARERAWARSADVVLATNEASAALLRRRFGVAVDVVMNCPPRPGPEVAAGERPRRFHETLHIDPDARVVLHNGSLVPHRGIEMLMEAIALVPRAVLVVMGFGPLFEDYRARAAELPWSDRVHVIPAVPAGELSRWVASADLVAVTIDGSMLNHLLATPNKLFEALSAGVPVVASHFPAMAPIVRDIGAGALCDPHDPGAIARAINEVLDATAQEQEARRARIHAAVTGQLNWAQQARAYLAAVRRVSADPGAGTPPR